jgi:hypothetical protein
MLWSIIFLRGMTLAISSVFATGCISQASPPPPPGVQTTTGRTGWFDCASDSECVLIRDPECYYTSVNRDRAADIASRLASDLDQRGELRECQPWSIDYVPVCLDGKCSSIRPKN